jgi:MFS superfamily sulfate permease-like transporter
MANADQRWGYGLPDQAPITPLKGAATAAATSGRWRHLRGDLTGGFTAAMLTIPISVGYGLLALSPLGQSATASAILAGLYAPVFGCLIALILGANTTMVYSPRRMLRQTAK